MKKILLLLLAVSVLMTHACCVVAAEAYPEDSSWMDMDTNKGLFYDVTVDMWFFEYVEKASERELVKGTFPNPYVSIFMPYESLTREQALAILNRIDEGFYAEDVGEFDTGFADVPSDSWFAPYVAWGVELGITDGVGGELFGAGRAISREELATFIYRYVCSAGANLKECEDVTLSFADSAYVSDWAKGAVEYLRSHGILTGDENGNVRPADSITRAEAVAMFVRLDEALIQNISSVLDFSSFDASEVTELRFTADVDGPEWITHSVTDKAEIERFMRGLDGACVVGSATLGGTNGTGGYTFSLYGNDGVRLCGCTFGDDFVKSNTRIYYLDKAYFAEYSSLLKGLVDDYYS